MSSAIRVPHLKDLQTTNNYPGMWKGVVEDTTDPQNIGRMRIRVPVLHGDASEIPTLDLPWAQVCLPAHSFAIPQVGDPCWVQFEAGNFLYPIYMGIRRTKPNGLVAKGALPTAGALNSRPPGNSPPPPIPESLETINASRVIISQQLNIPLESVPHPLGYGLDGIIKNPLGTFDDLMKRALAYATKNVPNLETYFHMPGNDVFDIALAKQSPDPVVRVLTQTPSGHCMAFNDDPGNEFAKVIDRSGQSLHFDCAVDIVNNHNNQAERPSLGEASLGTGLDVLKMVNQTAGVRLTDIVGQAVRLIGSRPGGVESSVVRLEGIGGQLIELNAAYQKEAIRLVGKAGHTIILDSTLGDESLTLTDKNGNQIVLDNDQVSVVSKEGHTITMLADAIRITNKEGHQIELNATGVVVGKDAGNVKHLAFIEDVMLLFNAHTHPGVSLGSGITPPPVQKFSLANGTTVTTAG